MAPTLGVVMDPISAIHPQKDSTIAMLLEAQRRGWAVQFMEQRDLYCIGDVLHARTRPLRVHADTADWAELGPAQQGPIETLDVILMRKDPPFDLEYIYTTYLLELAERRGVLVVNRPAALRSYNEKFALTRFAHCAPPTLVTRERARIREFAAQHGELVVKPLDSMGGNSIFRLRPSDPNLNVILETITQRDQRTVMAQLFLPSIAQGDKRILLIDGTPIPYALARIPAADDTRGNLAAGARGEGIELGVRERWICEQVGPTLRADGLVFVGLDVIGDYLTEVNVTSPTGIRELDRRFGINIASLLFDAIHSRLAATAPG